jgi:hypothetical protein
MHCKDWSENVLYFLEYQSNMNKVAICFKGWDKRKYDECFSQSLEEAIVPHISIYWHWHYFNRL